MMSKTIQQMTSQILNDKRKYLKFLFNNKTYQSIQQQIDDGDEITITNAEYSDLKTIKKNYLKAQQDFILSDEFMENQNKMMHEYLEYEKQQKQIDKNDG